MFPINIAQIKSFKLDKIIKIFVWALLRNFQFNNKRKYEAVYFTDQSVISTDGLYIPNNVRVVDKITKSTLILINKVKLGIFLNIFSSSKFKNYR